MRVLVAPLIGLMRRGGAPFRSVRVRSLATRIFSRTLWHGVIPQITRHGSLRGRAFILRESPMSLFMTRATAYMYRHWPDVSSNRLGGCACRTKKYKQIFGGAMNPTGCIHRWRAHSSPL